MESIKKLVQIFNKKQKIQFVILFITQFIGALLELLGVSVLIPFIEAVMNPERLMENAYVKDITGAFGISSSRQLVIAMVAVMIAVYVVKNCYLTFMLYLQYQIIWKNRLDMELQIMKYYVRQPYMFHVMRNSAEMQRTILTDVGNIFEVLNNTFLLISEVLTSVMLVVLLLLMDVPITLLVICMLLAFMLLYFKVFRKRLYQYGKIAQKYGAEGLKVIGQTFRGIKEIKVFECEEYFVDEFEEGRRKQISMMKRSSFFQQTPKYALEMLLTCGVLSVLLLKMMLGADIAHLVTQLSVFAFAAYRIMPSANRIMAETASIFNNKASIDLVYSAIKNDKIELKENQKSYREETEALMREEQLKDIQVQQVTFSYSENERKILDNVTLEIPGGASVAFKGASGAGKTTLADLILGILKPDSGNILYGGENIETLGRLWHSHIGYIPQTIYMGDETIGKNVAFGVKEPEEDKIWSALEGAQLREFVEGLPEKLDTRIGESGVRLSGGQRQRIGIARALYHNPDILILDEATSALDQETEKAVMESINYLKGKKTLIIIAHRLSTIENCDVVYEVGAGNVTVARGKAVTGLEVKI